MSATGIRGSSHSLYVGDFDNNGKEHGDYLENKLID